MTDAAEQSKLVAHSIMAQGQLERLQSYLDRGRLYENLSAADLERIWLAEASAWGADPFEPKMAMDDGTAEYEMRGLKPPYDLAAKDLEKGIAAIGARADQMSDEEKREANERMVADHEQNTRSKN